MVAGQTIYEICRYDVSADGETLVDRLRLCSDNGQLIVIDGDGVETPCDTDDVAALVGADPRLSAIKPNQITRVTASSDVVDQLPFVLQIPGDIDEYDESMWSEPIIDKYLDQEWEIQIGLYRVLFVNAQRWCPWPTTGGSRVLPEDWPEVRFQREWVRLNFTEWGSMTSGTATFSIGLATSAAVVTLQQLDELDAPDVQLSRRGENAADDAAQVMHWLFDGGLLSDPGDPTSEGLVAQLFVEAIVLDHNGVSVPGSRLAAGSTTKSGFGDSDSDSAERILAVDMPPEMIDTALNTLAARSPRMREIVAAAIDPSSPPGRARAAALDAWSAAFTPPTWLRPR
jgi:hypothetical protein